MRMAVGDEAVEEEEQVKVDAVVVVVSTWFAHGRWGGLSSRCSLSSSAAQQPAASGAPATRGGMA